MLRRVVSVAIGAVMLAFCALPAEAGEPKPLRLQDYVISIVPPRATTDGCDLGSRLNCGLVSVEAHFTGLEGRPRVPETGAPTSNLSGTARISRTYGCQEDAKRVARYDRRIDQDTRLITRRNFGFRIPLTGDVLDATTYAFLLDAQPGNCPAGMQAMIYEIRASNIRLYLETGTGLFPNKYYQAPGKARWCGAVSTPTALTTGP